MTQLEIKAQVVRYDVTKASVVRNALPLVLLITSVGKYVGVYMLVIAGLCQVSLLVLFLKARSNFGAQDVAVKADALLISSMGAAIRRGTVPGWILSGHTARVYGPKFAYCMSVTPAQQCQLEILLTQALGARIVTTRRGSARARWIALTIGIAGPRARRVPRTPLAILHRPSRLLLRLAGSARFATAALEAMLLVATDVNA